MQRLTNTPHDRHRRQDALFQGMRRALQHSGSRPQAAGGRPFTRSRAPVHVPPSSSVERGMESERAREESRQNPSFALPTQPAPLPFRDDNGGVPSYLRGSSNDLKSFVRPRESTGISTLPGSSPFRRARSKAPQATAYQSKPVSLRDRLNR